MIVTKKQNLGLTYEAVIAEEITHTNALGNCLNMETSDVEMNLANFFNINNTEEEIREFEENVNFSSSSDEAVENTNNPNEQEQELTPSHSTHANVEIDNYTSSSNTSRYASFFEELNIQLDVVESSFNFPGNYQNYVSRVLHSAIPIKKFNYLELIEEKKVNLPEKETNKKTLILDLDETLVHADFEGNYMNHDELISFEFQGQEINVPIILRPGLYNFLDNISENFEIIIFTASKKEYADAVLNFIDPYNSYFKIRLYRESCINIKNRIFIKDLRILNRKPEDIVIVDNSLYSFVNQLSNGILINSFYDDREDRELFNLFNYLQQYLLDTKDVRTVNEKIFNFNSILEGYIQLDERE